jgi:type IV pilus assembly protein PilO
MASLKLKSGSGLDNLSILGKLLIGFVFVVIVGAAYFLVFYGDVSSQIEAKKTEIDAQQAQLDEAKAAERNYNADLKQKNDYEQQARKHKKILPDDPEMPTFLSSLQTVATVSGVTFTSWEPGEQTPEEFYAKVPMQVKVEGKFHQVAKFFYGVGQVDRIINMENIVITVKDPASSKKTAPGTEEEPSTVVQVECLATAFRALATGEVGKKRAGGDKPK